MKLFDPVTESESAQTVGATLLMEVVPLVMRRLRTEMRSHRTYDLTVAQFRALAYVSRHPGASLSDVAEHIGLTLPSVSKLIDGLVARGLVRRETSATDRRRVRLNLTRSGKSLLTSARRQTQASLAGLLSTLPPNELGEVLRALETLRSVFGPPGSKR